jgi:hypothetical protein
MDDKDRLEDALKLADDVSGQVRRVIRTARAFSISPNAQTRGDLELECKLLRGPRPSVGRHGPDDMTWLCTDAEYKYLQGTRLVAYALDGLGGYTIPYVDGYRIRIVST